MDNRAVLCRIMAIMSTLEKVVSGWRSEFGKSYDVPEAVYRHARLVDRSWHNDAMPLFHVRGVPCVVLWADHPEAEERECSGKRFGVYLSEQSVGTDLEDQREEGPEYQEQLRQYRALMERFGGTGDWHGLLETDDLGELLAFIESLFSVPTVEALAKAFAKQIREDMPPEELEEANRRNEAYKAKGESFCATHEFIDPNQSMIDAWESLTLAPIDSERDQVCAVMDAAWGIAKASGFNL